jgi:hypothetical protein
MTKMTITLIELRLKRKIKKKYGENGDVQLVEFVDIYMSSPAPKTWIM